MKKCAVVLVWLALFTACAHTPAGSVTAAPVPTDPPAPTMAPYEEVSFDDWRNSADCTMPDYSFSAPHELQLNDKVAWPTEGVTLCCTADTLEKAAEVCHTTVENLKELNPDWQDNYNRNGCYYCHQQYNSYYPVFLFTVMSSSQYMFLRNFRFASDYKFIHLYPSRVPLLKNHRYVIIHIISF